MQKIPAEVSLKTISGKIDKLGSAMEAGFRRVEKNIEERIEELARMVATGFENTSTKQDFNELKSDVTQLQTDMSDVKLRLDHLAPAFEVRDLEKRVRKLEVKIGLRHS